MDALEPVPTPESEAGREGTVAGGAQKRWRSMRGAAVLATGWLLYCVILLPGALRVTS